MDVGFHHGCVHAHSASVRHSLFVRDFHHSFVNLLDHLRPERNAPASHSFGIRHLPCAHTGKVAIHKIGTHFALQYRVAPVADVLENQQPHNHVGGEALTATAAALGTPLPQSRVNWGD